MPPKKIPFYKRRGGQKGAASTPPESVQGEISFTLTDEHAAAMKVTDSYVIKCLPDYRRRVMRFIKFLKDHYSTGPNNLYDQLVFELTPDDLKDETRHYHKATHDLRYNLIPSEIVHAFLSGELQYKDKKNKTEYSYDHKRKYHDALLYCSQFADEENGPVTATYKVEMKSYLDSLEKQSAAARSNGKMDERDADPWCFTLFMLICTWAVETGNIFVWAFLVLQWSIMGRCCNVDAIGLHNFKAENDSVVFCLDTNKKDQKGEKVTEKHCYANPLKPVISLFLVLGVYLSLFQSKFKKKKDGTSSDKLFRAKGRDGSSSNTYCKSLRKMLAKKWEIVWAHSIRMGHFNPHGTRKGAAVHVTTATMEPPPIPSVLLRGEWSMGKVIEVYWRYSQLGDTYLGRCLAGLFPDQPQFGILPPHFTVGSDNPYVKEGMRACFGVILDNFGHCGCEGALLLFLASIVYHSDEGGFLMETIANNPNHPFMDIPILSNKELLKNLRDVVTTDPTPLIMVEATGVPQTVKLQDRLREFSDEIREFRKEFEDLKLSLPDMMKNAVDEKIKEAGQVSPGMVIERLDEVSKVVTTEMSKQFDCRFQALEDRLDGMYGLSGAGRSDEFAAVQGGEVQDVVQRPEAHLYKSYSYQDPFASATKRHLTDWDVPETFSFPSPTPLLESAWKAWLIGYPHLRHKNGDTITATPVRPLRLLKHGRLPSKVKKKYDNSWKVMLDLMEEEVHDEIKNKPVNEIDTAFLDSTFARAMVGVSRKYPQFEEKKTWKIGTCSKEIKTSNAKAKKRKADALANSTLV